MKLYFFDINFRAIAFCREKLSPNHCSILSSPDEH
jgi:hypothetical protein